MRHRAFVLQVSSQRNELAKQLFDLRQEHATLTLERQRPDLEAGTLDTPVPLQFSGGGSDGGRNVSGVAVSSRSGANGSEADSSLSAALEVAEESLEAARSRIAELEAETQALTSGTHSFCFFWSLC